MSGFAADLKPILRLFFAERRRALLLGAALSAATVTAGIALLGLSGWFITATSLAGLSAAAAITFDVFAPSAGIRLLAIVRTAARYGERLTTHDATLGVLAALRERLFRGFAEPGAARALLHRPARLLYRLTADIDALDSLYLRILVPAAVATGAALAASLVLGLMHPVFGLCFGLFLAGAGLGLPLIAGRAARKHARRRAHGIEALRSRTIDLVAGQTDLLMAGRLAAQRGTIAAADAYSARADDRLNRVETGLTFGFGLVSTLLLTASLLAVAVLAETKVPLLSPHSACSSPLRQSNPLRRSAAVPWNSAGRCLRQGVSRRGLPSRRHPKHWRRRCRDVLFRWRRCQPSMKTPAHRRSRASSSRFNKANTWPSSAAAAPANRACSPCFPANCRQGREVLQWQKRPC